MSPAPATPEKEVFCAVLDGGNIAVVRIVGRGNFQNSVPLKQFADRLQAESRPGEFIMDLAECETLDSTFMGVLAAISIAQQGGNRHRVIVVNANQHVRKLLKTLGLTHLLDVQDGAADAEALVREAEDKLKPAQLQPVSKTEQICHTLMAHKALVGLEDGNEVRFQSVIHYLEESLQQAKEGKEVL